MKSAIKSTLKFSRIALAVAALVAGSAHAAITGPAATVVDNANANGRVFFVSGASAVDAGFNSIITNLFTGTTYRFNASGFTAVAGTAAAGAGPWSGQNVIVIYRTKGGSVFGVNPVARNEKIESLVVTSAACSGAASPFTCPTTGTASPETTGRVPDAGVSDVAPFIFKAPVNTEGETPAPSLSSTELALLTPTPIYGLAFGVPVTNTVGSAVKLTRSDVAAIFTGNVSNWSQIDASESGDIVVCRRVPGSGTQSTYNLWAGGFACVNPANAPADRDASSAWNPATRTFTVSAGMGELVVIENSTSSQVRTCLDTAVSGGSYNTTDRDGNAVTVTFNGGGHKAIGTLSLDSLSSSRTTGAGGKWQFRSLNGAGTYTWDNTAGNPVSSGTGTFPTKAVYENGDWDLQGQVSFNVPTRTGNDSNKAPLAARFVTLAQDPDILAASSSLKNVAMGIPGLDSALEGHPLATTQVLDAAYLTGNQCSPYNRNFAD